MKFNIFSKKKKKNKGALIKATDFLNPRDGNSTDLEDKKKEKKKKKESSKQENKVSKKELRRAEKKKKAEAKKAKREEEERKKEEEKKEKEKKKTKESSKQENKVSKKELRKAEKKKKAEVKKAKEEEEERKKEEEKKEKEKKSKDSKDKVVKEEENKKEEKKEDKDTKDDLQEKKEVQGKKTLEQEEQVEEDAEKDSQTSPDHEFEKSNILEINLVKDEINVYFDWYKNIAMLIIFIFLSFILVTEIYLALSWWQSENDSVVSQEEARFIELSEETKKIRGEAEEALTFQTKLNRANYILDNHLYWSNLFDYLERNTLKNVQYLSFEGDILGNFSIPAISDSFPSLGQQIYQLQSDPNTLKASINSGEKLESEEENIEEVEFEIRLKVSPELFKK